MLRTGALLDVSSASREVLGLTAGQSFVVWAPGGCHHLRLTGITKTRRLPEAKHWRPSGRCVPGRVRNNGAFPRASTPCRYVLLADLGADRDRTREALARHLPSGLLVQQPGARTALADETLSAATGAA